MKKHVRMPGLAKSLLLAFALAGVLTGCGIFNKEETAREEMEFTVVSERELPEELLAIIEENKENEIRMSYVDGEEMYLIRGYGTQKTGGYSIAVAECTEDEERIVFDTRLIGPQGQETTVQEESYPYIVVKVKASEKEVEIE